MPTLDASPAHDRTGPEQADGRQGYGFKLPSKSTTTSIGHRSTTTGEAKPMKLRLKLAPTAAKSAARKRSAS